MAAGDRFPKIVLLLGSYDKRTKSILYRLKEQLEAATITIPEQVCALLLDEIELYKIGTSGRELLVLVEAYDRGITLSVLDALHMISSEDFDGHLIEESDEIVSKFVQMHYQTSTFQKLSILDKVKEVARVSALVFLVRHLSMTRGGEYIELAFLLLQRLDSTRIIFFQREGIDVSEMAWEILDLYKVSARPYKSEDFLLREAVRVVRSSSV